MKAYASVHLPKLLVTFLAISLFVLVIWLDGYRNYLVIGYGLLLFGLFIVLVYLVDYLSNTAFYQYIKHEYLGSSNENTCLSFGANG